MSLYIFVILIAIVAFLLILVIMVQNPKGGGLDSNFGGGGNMLGGVKQTSDFLDKATWVLFSLLILLILISNSVIIKSSEPTKSKIKQAIENNTPLQDDNKTVPNPLIPSKNKKPEEKK